MTSSTTRRSRARARRAVRRAKTAVPVRRAWTRLVIIWIIQLMRGACVRSYLIFLLLPPSASLFPPCFWSCRPLLFRRVILHNSIPGYIYIYLSGLYLVSISSHYLSGMRRFVRACGLVGWEREKRKKTPLTPKFTKSPLPSLLLPSLPYPLLPFPSFNQIHLNPPNQIHLKPKPTNQHPANTYPANSPLIPQLQQVLARPTGPHAQDVRSVPGRVLKIAFILVGREGGEGGRLFSLCVGLGLFFEDRKGKERKGRRRERSGKLGSEFVFARWDGAGRK